MPDDFSSVIAIVLMGGVVYLTRMGGYMLGLQVRHIGWLRPVLEALPGCAMMALLVPAVAQGSVIEFVALASVVLIMWFANSIVMATVMGLGILLFGERVLTLIAV